MPMLPSAAALVVVSLTASLTLAAVGPEAAAPSPASPPAPAFPAASQRSYFDRGPVDSTFGGTGIVALDDEHTESGQQRLALP